MEEPDLLTRVSSLEQEVKALKTSLQPDAKPAGLAAQCQNFVRFLIANWVLLSFLCTLVVLGYVKYKFDIDYFESYRNTATNRQLSRFYEQMGDVMMGRVEWRAAEEAYHTATQINSNNAAATFGMIKAQVFQPLPGEKYYAPEVVDARLTYLLDRFPDDYQIYFLKALRYQAMGKNNEAVAWLRKCIDRNPKFTGCYLEIGMLDYGQSKVADAEANFAKAVELDPNFAAAKNDLAACHALLSDFSGATRLFEESDQISPSAVTEVSLGEVYWYSRQFDAALEAHQYAADNMEKGHDMDRYLGGPWTSGYLPLHAGDFETIKTSTQIGTLEQKKAMTHFELAIDHALLAQYSDADREFAAALKFKPPPDLDHLIQNRLRSVENMVPMPDASKRWLAEHHRMLH